MLLTFWPPPRIEGKVLVLEALPSVLEDSLGQLFHTQHERSFPALSSSPVTTTNPMTNTIPPARRLRMSREGPLDGGMEEGFEKGGFNLTRNLLQRVFFLKPPGMYARHCSWDARQVSL